MSDWAAAPAPLARRLLTVLGVEQLGAYRVLRVADVETPEPRPGQFAMIAAAERWGGGADERPYLARAFSIARRRVGESHFLLEDVGPGTKRLCALREGEDCGRSARSARASRRRPSAGARSSSAAASASRRWRSCRTPWRRTPNARSPSCWASATAPRAAGAALLRGARVATDDGSVGHHGLLTELLSKELYRDSRAQVYACGPAPMLEAVRAMCATRDVPAQLALEAGMACGFGACFGCAVPKRGGGYLRVCLDGPVIDAAELEHVDAHAGAPA